MLIQWKRDSKKLLIFVIPRFCLHRCLPLSLSLFSKTNTHMHNRSRVRERTPGPHHEARGGLSAGHLARARDLSCHHGLQRVQLLQQGPETRRRRIFNTFGIKSSLRTHFYNPVFKRTCWCFQGSPLSCAAHCSHWNMSPPCGQKQHCDVTNNKTKQKVLCVTRYGILVCKKQKKLKWIWLKAAGLDGEIIAWHEYKH